MQNISTFGDHLRASSMHGGLTQREVAEILKVDQGTVCDVENGSIPYRHVRRKVDLIAPPCSRD